MIYECVAEENANLTRLLTDFTGNLFYVKWYTERYKRSYVMVQQVKFYCHYVQDRSKLTFVFAFDRPFNTDYSVRRLF